MNDDVALTTPEEQARVRQVLESVGLEPLLDLKTIRRVERRNNLEVWGPVG